MSNLHEILSVEGDLEGSYKKIIEETTNTFSKKVHLFNGSHKKLEMFDSEKYPDTPEEFDKLSETVPSKLEYMFKSVIRYYDAVLQKERTNQDAKADLIVDGVVLGKDLPATFLLGLESKLKSVRSVIESAPTLPPGTNWVIDESQGPNVYRAEHPEKKFRTAKTVNFKVLTEATDKHVAQIREWDDVQNVGMYITQTWCGMISPAEKSALLERTDKLIRAAKKARQRANNVEVVNMNIGKEITNFILGK